MLLLKLANTDVENHSKAYIVEQGYCCTHRATYLIYMGLAIHAQSAAGFIPVIPTAKCSMHAQCSYVDYNNYKAK